jgi:transposase
MTTTRKTYSPKFKARVAIEAVRGDRTLSQLGSQFKVHPMQIAKWRKTALDQLPDLFVDGPAQGQRRRGGQRRAVRGDRAVEGGVGLGQKKGWHARVRICVRWWTGTTTRSASGGSAIC